jgi:hypothetical protein
LAAVATKDQNPPDPAVRPGRPERGVCADIGHWRRRSAAVPVFDVDGHNEVVIDFWV